MESFCKSSLLLKRKSVYSNTATTTMSEKSRSFDPINFYNNFNRKQEHSVNDFPGAELGSASKILNRRNTYLEMMGYPKSFDSRIAITSLHVDHKTPTISLTDLMGNGKHKFLKKTGFLSIYDDCKKLKESKNIITGKHALTIPNIMHADTIREFNVKSVGNSPRGKVVSNLFQKPKYVKQQKKTRLDEIQIILEKCDALYLETSKNKKYKNFLRQELLSEVQTVLSENKKRRLTNLEIKAIKIEAERML